MTAGQLAYSGEASSSQCGELAFLRHMLATCALAGLSVAPAAAQATADQNDVIVITRDRPTLLVSPERTIPAADLSTYGLSTIGELIDEIAAEEGSRADPVAILIDGRLASGRSSIDDYPVESVERVEVLAPGAAARSGGSANVRAINIVLRPRSRVLAARGAVRVATEGGSAAVTGELGLTAIDQPRRINLTARAMRENALLESERDVDQAPGSPDGIGRLRSLRGGRERIDLGLAASDQLATWLHASLNIKLVRGDNRARLGLSPIGDPLLQRGWSTSAFGDLQLEADRGEWRMTMDSSYREDRQRTVTSSPLNSSARRVTRSISRDRSVELRANGPILRLPAGQARLTVSGAWDRNSIEGRSGGSSNRFSQTTQEVRLGIDLPLTSRAAGFAPWLGELGLAGELRRGRASGLGSTSSESITVRWEPTTWLRFFGALSSTRSPPSAELLGATPIETPGVRYFDPVRGETVDVVTTSGGNPALGRFRVDSRLLSIRLQPVRELDLVLSGEYSETDTRNIVSALPPASVAVINAFPDRFTRDSNGRLTAVDLRAVGFGRGVQSQLRHDLNLVVPLGARDRNARGGRVQLTASHTMLLSSKLTISDGGPTIDLLSRRAAGFGGVTRPRHQFDLALGYAERGLGIRLSAERRSASYLDLGRGTAGDVLTFESLTIFGLRAFAEGSRLMPDIKWLKGARFTLTATNLSNDRESVRDRTGFTPLSYQPAYRDPLGRTIELEFRKAF